MSNHPVPLKKLGIGTAQFGADYGISNRSGQTSSKEAGEILDEAYRVGIEIVDTASAYGDSESVVGAHGAGRFKVVTKFMPSPGQKPLKERLNRSLKRLNISSLYGYLAHRPMELLKNRSDWDELMLLKESGLIQKAGYSLNSPSELSELLDAGYLPDLVQAPFNYLDRRFRDSFIALQKKGCEIHARSVFLQGLFFLDMEELDPYFEPLAETLKELQSTTGNLPAALIQFTANQPFIDRIILGVESKKQLLQNIEAFESGTRETLPDTGVENIPESILMPMNWPKNR